MKLTDALKKIGVGLLGATPAGAAALAVVNAFLPDGKKLTNQHNGDDALSAIQTLPPDIQAKLEEAEIYADVEHDREWTKRFEAMTAKDDWGWVRPVIVLGMALLVFLGTSFYIGALAHAAWVKDATSVTAVGNTWPLLAAALAFPIAIIRSWFGFREQGKQRKAEVAMGKEPTPMEGMMAGVIKAFRG